jgi:putative membrane protein
VFTALPASTLAAAAVMHPGAWHPVLFPFFFLIPIFWILVIGLIVFLVSRRRRVWAQEGWGGPWGHGGPGAWTGGGRSAEATLADRFANGDIDEKEYRARLEVLRASHPLPPQR